MNNKGFTLIELLASLALLGLILCIGLYVTRGTLATSLSTLTEVSENEIYSAAKLYVLENKVTWNNFDNYEYTCLMMNDLVDKGYFYQDEVREYENDLIKVIRISSNKTIENIKLVDSCQ